MRSLISIALVVAAGATALAAATERFQVFTAEGARRYEVSRQPQAIPDIELEDARGRRVSLSALKGKRVVVEFFYTGCQTLCVVLTGSLGELQRQLRAGTTDVHLLSISFAPGDDITKLAYYAQRVHADATHWTIARPVKTEDLPRLLHAFGIVVIPGKDGEFEHNAAFHVLDREGRLSFIGDFDRPDLVATHLNLSGS